MRKDRDQALKLRLEGKSYNEISTQLRVPKSTLSGWFTGLILSKKAQERIKKRVADATLRGLVKRNKNQTHLAINRMRTQRDAASREITDISLRDLCLIGIALYWAEGYKRTVQVGGKEKTHHSVALSNSDPVLAKIFIRFLREVCNVPDTAIRINVRLYEHMNQNKVVEYWMQKLNLPRGNFGHVYWGVSRASQGKRPFNRLLYGTIQIRVNNTNLFHRIMGWIEGLQKQCAPV